MSRMIYPTERRQYIETAGVFFGRDEDRKRFPFHLDTGDKVTLLGIRAVVLPELNWARMGWEDPREAISLTLIDKNEYVLNRIPIASLPLTNDGVFKFIGPLNLTHEFTLVAESKIQQVSARVTLYGFKTARIDPAPKEGT